MKKWVLYFAIIVIGILIGIRLGSDREPTRKVFHYSGCIADGYNSYGTHGLYNRTIDFSPDEKHVVYLWGDSSYALNSEWRPDTLTASIEVRVRPLPGTAELRIPLDSVDLRPNGETYYQLDAKVQVAPDSKHAAALCARRLVLIDLATKTTRTVEYTNEFFGSFSWRDGETLCFSTSDEQTNTFWRWRIDSHPNERSSVYQRKTSEYTLNARTAPPSLEKLRWSQDGRYVEFRSANETNGVSEHVLDLDTRALKEPPASIRMLGWVKENTVRISSNGHYEARIDKGKLVVLKPESSTGARW